MKQLIRYATLISVIIILVLGVRNFNVTDFQATLGQIFVLDTDWTTNDLNTVDLPLEVDTDTIILSHNINPDMSSLRVELNIFNADVIPYLDDVKINNDNARQKGVPPIQFDKPKTRGTAQIFDIPHITETGTLKLVITRRDKTRNIKISSCSLSDRDVNILNQFRNNIIALLCIVIILMCSVIFIVFDIVPHIARIESQHASFLIIVALYAVISISINSNILSLFLGNDEWFSHISSILLSLVPLALMCHYRYKLKIVKMFEPVICVVTIISMLLMELCNIKLAIISVTIATLVIIFMELLPTKKKYLSWYNELPILLLTTYVVLHALEDTDQKYSVHLMSFLLAFIHVLWMWQIGNTLVKCYQDKHKAYAQTLQDKVNEAERANKAKDNFLANMSHEIRTPINAILGMNEAILRESTEDNIKGYAFDINSSGHTLLSLINDILDFSKIEAGKMQIIPVEYDMSSMLNDIINIAKARIGDKDLELVTDIDECIPSKLYGDDVRIRQVITNILTNAIKYTPQGKVTLSVTAGQFVGDTTTLHVSIVDTGIGIKEEDLSKLTQAYQRVDEKQNRSIEGTGLGLAITNQLLSMMSSKLNISSTYGEGSTFSFELKQKVVDKTPIGNLHERIEQASQSFHYTESFYAPNAHILVVDDNDINRKVFRNLLKFTGVQITEASSGQDSIELAHSNKFDIIFMDHMMPELDGVQALHEIRKFDTSTPIFALTANAVTGAKEYYLGEGFTGFLSKPIDSSKLEALICNTLKPELLETPQTEVAEKTSIVFPEIEGIDFNLAQERLGSPELVMETLVMFKRSLTNQIENLENFKQNKDWNNYRILVHSMKSSTALLGMSMISELAKLLEYAARDGDLDRIEAVHPIFKCEWLAFDTKLRTVVSEEKNQLPELDDETKRQLFTKLKNSIEEFETEEMDNVAQQLSEFNFAEKEKLLLSIDQLDTDTTLQLIKQMWP